MLCRRINCLLPYRAIQKPGYLEMPSRRGWSIAHLPALFFCVAFHVALRLATVILAGAAIETKSESTKNSLVSPDDTGRYTYSLNSALSEFPGRPGFSFQRKKAALTITR